MLGSSGDVSHVNPIFVIPTRKLTRLRRRIGLQVKLFLLNLYVVGSLPCILKSNWIGLQVKLVRGERERNEQLTGGKSKKIFLTFLYFSLYILLILVAINHL